MFFYEVIFDIWKRLCSSFTDWYFYIWHQATFERLFHFIQKFFNKEIGFGFLCFCHTSFGSSSIYLELLL